MKLILNTASKSQVTHFHKNIRFPKVFTRLSSVRKQWEQWTKKTVVVCTPQKLVCWHRAMQQKFANRTCVRFIRKKIWTQVQNVVTTQSDMLKRTWDSRQKHAGLSEDQGLRHQQWIWFHLMRSVCSQTIWPALTEHAFHGTFSSSTTDFMVLMRRQSKNLLRCVKRMSFQSNGKFYNQKDCCRGVAHRIMMDSPFKSHVANNETSKYTLLNDSSR